MAGFQPPLERPRRLGERIRLLLSAQPAHEWRAEDVASRLALSEATLRRRLAEETTGFRDILEEVRLVHGLALVQGTDKPLKQVAVECGYASPSRFTARFRERFGTLPSDLRD
nr:helix-turn-helix transcriptional regulator [Dyella sp. ASV21]